jgi:hypothetical protein
MIPDSIETHWAPRPVMWSQLIAYQTAFGQVAGTVLYFRDLCRDYYCPYMGKVPNLPIGA